MNWRRLAARARTAPLSKMTGALLAALLLCASAAPAHAQPSEDDAPARENMLEIGAQAGLLFRQLQYNDDIYGFLRDYQLRNAATFGGYVVAYPLAIAMSDNLLGRLGVELQYGQMQQVDSRRADGAAFPTRSHEVILGLRFRLLGASLRQRGFDVSAGLGYAQHMFRVRSAIAVGSADNRPQVPSVRYRTIRLDVNGRVPLDAGFFLTGHLGLRIVADAGDIDGDAWFPRARRVGVEAGLHVGHVLPKNLEVLAGFESRRYSYNVRPEPGDFSVVGGVLDRQVIADVRLGWRY